MYCKICRKNVRSISHWTQKHRKYLQDKRRRAPKRKKRSSSVQSKFCPTCGKKK